MHVCVSVQQIQFSDTDVHADQDLTLLVCCVCFRCAAQLGLGDTPSLRSCSIQIGFQLAIFASGLFLCLFTCYLIISVSCVLSSL